MSEVKPALSIPFINDNILLIDHNASPFVPLEPLCRALGINLKRQIERTRKSRRPFGCKLVHALIDGNEAGYYWAIPLENLSWFLNTLRPQAASNQIVLIPYAERCARSLLFFWSRYQRDYVSTQKIASDIAIAQRFLPQREQITISPKRDTPLTPAAIDKMKSMKRAGESCAAIGKIFGYSRTTVSLAIRGKYQTKSAHGT